MRIEFEKELQMLNAELTQMGALCENAIACAIRALLENNTEVANETLAVEDEINQAERNIENLCIRLILKQQPVAADLRQISSALKMITDMERIGDQAADIANIVMHTDMSREVNSSHIGEMANRVSKMVTESVDAYVMKDEGLAADVIRRDDEVDDLFKRICSELGAFISENPDKAEETLDMMMTAKYLERIGDHAVNIGEWVQYSITGVHRKDKMKQG